MLKCLTVEGQACSLLCADRWLLDECFNRFTVGKMYEVHAVQMSPCPVL